jgi:hypothetical protein
MSNVKSQMCGAREGGDQPRRRKEHEGSSLCGGGGEKKELVGLIFGEIDASGF